MTRFPDLFRARFPRAVVTVLPPLVDHARAQALAFAAAGLRNNTERRHFAVPDGADSSVAREPTRAAIPGLGGVAALWTLLDSTDRVSGVVAAPGGSNRTTIWMPLTNGGQRWGTVVDRLRAADTALHETGAARAPLRVLPVASSALYVQPAFIARPGASPTLAHVAVLMSDTVRIGGSFAAAVGAQPPPRPLPNAPADLRARADSLYRVMREALARGDWSNFGRAFDALGGAIKGLPR